MFSWVYLKVMRVIIELDVPEWQIGQKVEVFFPDTMMKKGVCELLKEQDNCENCSIAIEDRQPVIRCKDCKWAELSDNEHTWCDHVDHDFCHNNDWFCADGERKEGR